jgi:hypothetical protein
MLRANHAERSPHRLLVIDTETRPVNMDRPEVQKLHLWCATLTRRHNIEPGKPRAEKFRGGSADSLAALIDGLARSDSSLWACCHNLNFDLAVTELPVRMAARDWRITEAALTTDDPWFRAAKGSKRLTVVDSWSFLPVSVADLGKVMGAPKLKMPTWDAPIGEWFTYCERDARIVSDAMTQLMDWWDANAVGNWSLTGPSTGWGSYRHMKPGPDVLIDPDPAARDFEAEAITGGRRLVSRIGKLEPGLFADLDIATAHLQAMRSCRLPWRRVREFDSLPLNHHLLSAEFMDIIADVEIETHAPRYPLRTESGVFYPVGRFRTTLPGPEVRDALRRGELRSVGRGIAYATSPHMAPWADWIASLLDATATDTPPAVRIAAKAWSRSVPGKWDGHTSEVVSREPDLRPGWSVEHGFIYPGRHKADFLTLAGECWTIRRDVWADDAFPAILAFIQSYTRLALGRIIDDLGAAVIVANTDGVIVSVPEVPAGPTEFQPGEGTGVRDWLRWLDWRCVDLSAVAAPFTVRVKSACCLLTVIGPQHILMGKKRKLSGVPKSARRGPNGRYVFQSWPKLHAQIERTGDGTYTTKRRSVSLANIPPAGWLWDDGRVTPMRLGSRGVRFPTEYDSVRPDGSYAALAPIERQHPLLRPTMAAYATRTAQDGRSNV